MKIKKSLKPTSKPVKGKTLNLPVVIADRYNDAIQKLLKSMYKSTRVVVDKRQGASAMRIAFNALLQRYLPKFNELAYNATGRMMKQALNSADVSVKASLKDAVTIDINYLPDTMKEVIKASTAEAVSLIKLIPQQFLTEVQGEVMRSIVSNTGLSRLVPYLNARYGKTQKHARLVAMDQTRKVYSSLARERCKAAGFEYFTWRHTGGETHPRSEHVHMDGKVYRYDDPPIIEEKTGTRGFPGQLINCRCRMQPLLVLPGQERPKIG